MSSPGSKPQRPAVVRRQRAAEATAPAAAKAKTTPTARKQSSATSTSAKSSNAKSSNGKGSSAKGSSATSSSAKASAAKASKRSRPNPTPVPTLSVAEYVDDVPVTGSGRPLMVITGLLAAVGSILAVAGDWLPYAVLDGNEVSAPISVWSVLAHVLVLAIGVGSGALLVTGRGGRVGLALLATMCSIAPGALLLHVFAGAFPKSHDLGEYYFGILHTTLSIDGRMGRTLDIAGWALLVLAGLTAIAAWRQVAERDLLPLGAGRRFASGAAGLAVLLAVTAYLVPQAITSVRKYTDPSGLVLTRELTEPRSVVGAAGLGLAGGILLLVGWVLAGAVVGSMTSRVTVVAGLAGLAGMLWYSALINVRDVAAGADLVAGPRLYLLVVAGFVAALAAAYAATVRARADLPLVSEGSDPFA